MKKLESLGAIVYPPKDKAEFDWDILAGMGQPCKSYTEHPYVKAMVVGYRLGQICCCSHAPRYTLGAAVCSPRAKLKNHRARTTCKDQPGFSSPCIMKSAASRAATCLQRIPPGNAASGGAASQLIQTCAGCEEQKQEIEDTLLLALQGMKSRSRRLRTLYCWRCSTQKCMRPLQPAHAAGLAAIAPGLFCLRARLDVARLPVPGLPF